MSVGALNEAIRTLQYRAPASFTGEDTVQFAVSDGGASGSVGIQADHANLTIVVGTVTIFLAGFYCCVYCVYVCLN